MKVSFFNGLLIAAAVAAAYLPIRAMPDRAPMPAVRSPLLYQAVQLAPVAGPFRLAGAWTMEAGDRRFGGLSALVIDRGRFLAVSDLGAVIRFGPPAASNVMAHIADLREGPGAWGKKWARDAESLARDPHGRGWWVGYEQNHSLWLYDPAFDRTLRSINLQRNDWRDNRGAEGLLTEGNDLLVLAESGREAMRLGGRLISRLELAADAEVAEAARAPDGSAWLLLRSKELQGISQWIAPLQPTSAGYRVGPRWAIPKGAFDNFEGMAIAPLPTGGWRFWLVTDDGHRVMARTLLVALDYRPPRHDKSPAAAAGLFKKPAVGTP